MRRLVTWCRRLLGSPPIDEHNFYDVRCVEHEPGEYSRGAARCDICNPA